MVLTSIAIVMALHLQLAALMYPTVMTWHPTLTKPLLDETWARLMTVIFWMTPVGDYKHSAGNCYFQMTDTASSKTLITT
jgi:hypothetical protein